jgi:exodeoxyribonuclease VII small subunit
LTKRGTKKALGEGSERTQEDADLSLEERLRRLDEIVAALEGGDVELERGLKLFEEGVRHIREAESLLSTAEMRVEELVGDAEAATTKPLESDRE